MDNPPDTENWATVGDAIADRMRQLKMSKARLARETGLSETTIRYIGRPENGHHKSALVAIAAALRWRHDHLTNILSGQPDKNTPANPLVKTALERLHAECGPLKDEISGLKEATRAINQKIDTLLALDPGTAVDAVRAREG